MFLLAFWMESLIAMLFVAGKFGDHVVKDWVEKLQNLRKMNDEDMSCKPDTAKKQEHLNGVA